MKLTIALQRKTSNNRTLHILTLALKCYNLWAVYTYTQFSVLYLEPDLGNGPHTGEN